MNKKTSALLIFLSLISLAMSSYAGDVRGVVSRPAKEPQATKKVDRYRSRSNSSTDVPADCQCQPHLYAVVYLTGDSLPPITLSEKIPVMAQKDIMFSPSVIVVPVGGVVEFPNLDPFFHNVFSYSKTKKFDLGRYPKGETEQVTFDKPGIVQVFCEIHFSMRAYIHVVPSPYYAVSNERGEFVISNVQPGQYTMHTWQENQPELKQTITVSREALVVTVE